MGVLIERVGCVEWRPTGDDRFAVLVRAIVGQQLSGHAAWAIYGRLAEQIGLTPEAVAAASEGELLGVGLSHRKAEYVHGIARAVLDGDVDLDALDELPDEDVVTELTGLRGIGTWSAQMFLLFALGRPDVLVADDLGIRAAAGRLFGLDRPATAAEVRTAGERWKPYRSAATLYLFRSGGGFPPCVGESPGARRNPGHKA